MPHVPNAPPGTRFFGRIDQFHCECPVCGTILLAHKDRARFPQREPHKHKRRAAVYNALASRLACWHCLSEFGVGLVLWSIQGHRRLTTPSDQEPTLRELRALASQSYGLWPVDKVRQGDALNLAIDAECICPPGGWRGDCKVHPRLFGGEQPEEPNDRPVPPVEYDEGEEDA